MKFCGYITLVGLPNSGKSTLFNALIGTKLAIVSAKPQTTRNRILGVCTHHNAQLVFLDTPGLHQTKGLPHLNVVMNQTAWKTLNDADLACYLIDVTRGWSEEDEHLISQILSRFSGKLFFLLSKLDKLKKHEAQETRQMVSQNIQNLLEREQKRSALVEFSAPFLFSSKRKEDILALKTMLASQLPEGPWLFAEEDTTDRPLSFLCSELVREQIFRQLGREIPYKVGVITEKLEESPSLARLMMTVFVEKSSQKSIVIGKQGSRLKTIGEEARHSLEKLLEKKVFLQLHVKVKENWTQNPAFLNEIHLLEEE